ncbi:membrane protein [Kiloniella spongiae]|uniref:Membrane protein n=1 Tax=Kiloniella spongiae TaxID=1489064 RepID=A0A0H2MEP1_9PROT|nr:YqaA family protein [Kiloniella spongiae]KLN60974.1 membrane protein [Kiloniella spongiae]
MFTLLSLFLGAFLAATILPFSSEIMLAAALNSGEYPKWLLVLIATTGNTLGAIVNWWLGSYLLRWSDHRWFPFSVKQLDQASEWFRKYGTLSLLLTWIPVIGDPLTFAAGVLKVRFILFLPLVFLGKGLRYIFIGWLF